MVDQMPEGYKSKVDFTIRMVLVDVPGKSGEEIYEKDNVWLVITYKQSKEVEEESM